MMRAIYLTQRPSSVGNLANVVHIDNKAVPTPQADNLSPHEIIVQVKASSINVDDLHVAEGSFLGGVPGLQSRKPSPKRPVVIGSDFSGIVTAVGSGVKDFTVGQRVCGMNKQQSIFSEAGTWADYTVTKSENLVPLPPNKDEDSSSRVRSSISFAEAAASVMPLFVVQGLIDAAGSSLRRGNERVVVIGASGGIGSMLIQMLKHIYPNIYIVGVCSGRNVKFVKGLGVDEVVDYTKGPVENTLNNKKTNAASYYDVVFDMVGGPASYKTGKTLLRPRKGRFITITGPVEWVGDEKLTGIGQVALIAKMIWYSFFLNKIPGLSHPYYHIATPTQLVKSTFQLAFEEGISPHIEKSIPFGDKTKFKDAVDLVQSHRAKGKIIVEMESSS